MSQAYVLFIILGLTIVFFVWGYYRYDAVALISLMSLVLLGVIPSEEAFSGFSNPAVITVAAVMIITSAISQTGLIELLLKKIEPLFISPTIQIGMICLIGAGLSSFMNNVGALALIMPLAIQSSFNTKISPSKILMPLSFATVLGGMTTKIGTPPNLLVSSYREQYLGASFNIFDFTPVGLTVASVAIAFTVLFGWRLVPGRRSPDKSTEDIYKIHDYISEVRIVEDSPAVGIEKYKLEKLIDGDYSILGLIRGRTKRLVIPEDEILQVGDILIIEATHEDLNNLITTGKLELVHGDIISAESLSGKDISTMEAVVASGARIEGRSWQTLRAKTNLHLNLLAISRAGSAMKNRLNHVNLHPGDVVLVQGNEQHLLENLSNLGLVPLAQRNIKLGFKRSILPPVLLFLVGILLASTQILGVAVAFTLVVVLMVVFNIIPIRQLYKSIDWSIIVMLGALIPLGGALKSTGAAQLISNTIYSVASIHSPFLILGLILLVTMTLSDIMNNAATAVVMAPIATNLAQSLQMNPDIFLMAVAIGASCSFLTPISHQNNTLIMGPGGFKFLDYLWLGIPVELIVLATALPALVYFW